MFIEKTFREMLENRSEDLGEKCFMVEPVSGDRMTYRQLGEEARQMGECLGYWGLEKGEGVLLLLANGRNFIRSYFGCSYGGGVAIPANTALRADEIAYLLRDSRCGYILTTEEFAENIPESARGKREILDHGLWLYILKEEAPCRQEGLPGIREEDLAMILYTSGTTGSPKGVMLTYHNLLSEAGNICEGHQLSRDDTALCVLPWFHINGLVITLISSILTGSRIVVARKFSVTHFWEYVDTYRVTWFSGVPTMYSHLLSRGKAGNWDIRSLRFARSASASLPVAVLEAFEREFGVPVIESYGITEGGSQITTNPLPPGKRKAGSVGMPVGCRIRILDPDGAELPPMREGEVAIQGENITEGYFHKPDENRTAFADGWFHSGDMGYLDEDGYLFLTGRIKELINRAGEKFSPREVDEVLYRMPQVELAAAVGVPDAIYGEETAAFIKLRKGTFLSEQEVLAVCREHLAYYKVPRYIYFVEEIPQGGNGKIQRLKLLEMYGSGQV
ncbi:MAG TPA: AMP-dependent synthetase [Lachnospiraceae bacterium]|nr:AMP-dependent synthetase [Lachnospiraceae bacterium]